MRKLIILFMTFPLFSCNEADLGDLNTFVVEAKSRSYPINDKVPTLKKIDALAFTQESARNPFSEPQAEIVTPVANAPKSCPQPNFDRKKQALEMYSLDNLIMRGTLNVDDQTWGLVQVSGGELHRIRVGYYLGLNHGKVLNVTKGKIELLELAADMDGCWQERVTQIALLSE
ncbi:MAG: pilus assembly protein PilP [Psychromonas sp.]